MTNSTLEQRIRDVQDGVRLPSEERVELLTAMCDHIGSPDPGLRDELVYRTLSTWVIDGVLDDTEASELLATCLGDDHLFLDVGSREDDSVFTRSFSVLYIAAVLYRHNRTPFLSNEEIREVETRLLRYGQQERDLRGYVDGKGWAHAPAHLADALDELAQCSAIEADGLEAILEVVRGMTTTAETVYVAGEDDRLVTAVMSVVERDVLDVGTIEDWITGFSSVEQTGERPADHRVRTNVKAFLSSLYCRSAGSDLSDSIRRRVVETRAEVTGFG